MVGSGWTAKDLLEKDLLDAEPAVHDRRPSGKLTVPRPEGRGRRRSRRRPLVDDFREGTFREEGPREGRPSEGHPSEGHAGESPVHEEAVGRDEGEAQLGALDEAQRCIYQCASQIVMHRTGLEAHLRAVRQERDELLSSLERTRAELQFYRRQRFASQRAVRVQQLTARPPRDRFSQSRQGSKPAGEAPAAARGLAGAPSPSYPCTPLAKPRRVGMGSQPEPRVWGAGTQLGGVGLPTMAAFDSGDLGPESEPSVEAVELATLGVEILANSDRPPPLPRNSGPWVVSSEARQLREVAGAASDPSAAQRTAPDG